MAWKRVMQASGWRVGQVVPVLVLIGCGVLLWPRLQEIDPAQVWGQLSEITASAWALAVIFTSLSFWAVGQYDVLAHRHLHTGLPDRLARRAGTTAIAASQLLGFGAVTGTVVRWRVIAGQSPMQVALVSATVSVLFLMGMIGITALSCLVLPTPPGISILAALCLTALFVVLTLTCCMPQIAWRGRYIDLPSLRTFAAAFGWAALDVTAAFATLYVLLPSGATPSVLALFPAFLLALGAGLYAGTPGGAGPFEVTLLTMTASGLPAQMDLTGLIAGILAFRVVYFAIPGFVAIATLTLTPAVAPFVPKRYDNTTSARTHLPRAESPVVLQNKGYFQAIDGNNSALWPTAQALVAMFDPAALPRPAFFAELRTKARNLNRFALLYKCSARTASAARAYGWSCLHIADDAILDLRSYDLNVPERAGLRRKLRKSGKAGIAIRIAHSGDLISLARIDQQWKTRNGPARGGTMGRYCPNYIARQHVVLAHKNGAIQGFATFHTGPREWSLDLMRLAPGAADGLMHAVVQAGIDAATSAGAETVSLAAIPACPNPSSRLWRSCAQHIVSRIDCVGLRQFKSSFAPTWRPLYVAAPSVWALTICVADIARAVRRPPKIAAPSYYNVSMLHNKDENYEVDSSAAA